MRYNINTNEISIDTATNQVSLGTNQVVDFGGLLKGYLSNQLALSIEHDYPDCTGVIINLGGDLFTCGQDILHEAFIFMLYNPVTGEEIPTALTNTALATSGIYRRRWKTNHGERHHIIDPKNQENPSCDLVSVSIIHQDGAIAEALTKLFLVRGVYEAIKIVPPKNYQYFAVTNNGDTQTNLI
jgi:thiamine biosynthesis lipoprotein